MEYLKNNLKNLQKACYDVQNIILNLIFLIKFNNLNITDNIKRNFLI